METVISMGSPFKKNRKYVPGFQIYIYDGRPLKNVKKGQTVTLVAKKRRLKMKSVTTGTKFESDEDLHNVGVWYRSKPVGFLKNGQKLKYTFGRSMVEVVRTGDYSEGVPELKVLRISKP